MQRCLLVMLCHKEKIGEHKRLLVCQQHCGPQKLF